MNWRERKDLPDDPADYSEDQKYLLGISGPLAGMSDLTKNALIWSLARAKSPDKPEVVIATALSEIEQNARP